MDSIRRLPLDKLEVGMYVASTSKGVEDDHLGTQGLISRPETLAKLKKKAQAEVYIDVKKGKDSPHSKPVAPNPESLKPLKKLTEEKKNAKKVYKEAVGLVGNILRDVKMGKAIDVGPVESLADDINNSVLNNENALLCLSQIREKDQYLLEHSINVGILMGVFARHLGYEKDTLHQLVTGALLHDIGKIRVPNQVLNKPGKLTEDEWKEMQNHVIYGVDVLKKSEGISKIAMDICSLHHERLDGSGYPNKLNHDNINTYGRMAAIVDVYDAITADRVYHKGKTPGQAIKFLLTLADSHLDKALLYDFVRCMSVYPVGAVVELSNGKVGVVLSTNAQDSAKPLVRTFYNARHKHYETPAEIDLSKKTHDITVKTVLEARDFGFNVPDFIEGD